MKTPSVRTCVVCGCTDDRACRGAFGPCVWVTRRPSLCSECLHFLLNVQDSERVIAILEACRATGVVAELKRRGTLS